MCSQVTINNRIELNLHDIISFDRAAQPGDYNWAIGDLGIVTNPFELFLDYALRIKARSPAPQTAVVQLAAGLALMEPSLSMCWSPR